MVVTLKYFFMFLLSLGVCYSSQGASQRYVVSESTWDKSVSVVTMHGIANYVYDPLYASGELFSSQGLVVALTDDWVDPYAAVSEYGVAVSPGARDCVK